MSFKKLSFRYFVPGTIPRYRAGGEKIKPWFL